MAGWSTMTGSPARRVLQTIACAVAAWALTATPALAAPAGFTLQISGISSPVGMAADTDDGCYWVTDGRSATTRTLVAVGDDGSEIRTVSWQATPQDVQALAWADGSLYVGDIGDPSGSRDHIQVLSPQSLGELTTSWRAWDLTYPDSPHDAAAMAVSPKGNIYVITRGASPAVYRAPSELSRDGENTLTRVAAAPAGVTDAVFLPDGQKLALRTNDRLTVIDAYSWKTLSTASISPSGGDAISADLDGKGLQLGGPSTKVTGADVPPTGARASATPSSTPAVAASAAKSAETGSSGNSGIGTLITLIAAGVLAVIAAVVVYRVH